MHHTYAYSAEKSRQLDRLAIEHYQYPGALLMQRAGWALFKAIPDNSGHIVIFAGGGNNGGDGYVAGFLALQAGLSVEILSLVPLNDLKGDAWLMANHAYQLGVTITPYDGTNRIDENTEVVIDALLGTGLKGPPRGLFATAIQTINQMDAYIIACDIPSGICADTGAAFDKAIAAHYDDKL
jgi:NAD(P)H-hydrate epimerase